MVQIFCWTILQLQLSDIPPHDPLSSLFLKITPIDIKRIIKTKNINVNKNVIILCIKFIIYNCYNNNYNWGKYNWKDFYYLVF